jgi:hypothetical protein
VEGKPGCITVGRIVLNFILTVLGIKYLATAAFISLKLGNSFGPQNENSCLRSCELELPLV